MAAPEPHPYDGEALPRPPPVRGKLPRWLLKVLENGEVVTFMASAVALLAIAIVVFVSGVHDLVVAPAWWSRCPSPWSWCGVTPGSTAPDRRRSGYPSGGCVLPRGCRTVNQ